MRFSVIIPVYNKADTICSAVESIYSQTFNDYEIIIVNDGSSDNLDEALFSINGPKLRLINQNNGGVSVARNTGVSNARGDYVCFLDADDLWKPNHLEILNGLIEKYPKSEAFVTSHEVVLPNENSIHSSHELKDYDEDFETDDFLGLLNSTSYSVVHTNSVCAKREMLKKNGIRFEPGIKIGEDTDVWYRLGLKNNVAVSKIETTVYRREFSTATRQSFHVQNWIFCFRLADILSDNEISDKKKDSVLNLIDRYKMTSSREYMLDRDRKKAKAVLSEVRYKKGKRYILTLIFTFLPYPLCELLLNNRY